MDSPLPCVIDASVSIKLFVPEEGSDRAKMLFSYKLRHPKLDLMVPDLFYIECANVFWKKVRRREMSVEDASNNLSDLAVLGLDVTPTELLMEDALLIACKYDISAYDACYVALSKNKGVPFITSDTRLIAKLEGSIFDIVALSTEQRKIEE